MNEYRNNPVGKTDIHRSDFKPNPFDRVQTQTARSFHRRATDTLWETMVLPVKGQGLQCAAVRNEGLRRIPRPIPDCEVIKMDQIVLSNHVALPDFGKSIEDLAIIQGGHLIAKLQNRGLTGSNENTVSGIQETFLVTDLLNDASYFVTHFDDHIQLLVSLKERLVVAHIDSGTDVMEIADRLVKQLST